MPDSVKGFTDVTKYCSDFLPRSTASQKVWYVCSSWYVVESPRTNLDCKGVKIRFTVT